MNRIAVTVILYKPDGGAKEYANVQHVRLMDNGQISFSTIRARKPETIITNLPFVIAESLESSSIE